MKKEIQDKFEAAFAKHAQKQAQQREAKEAKESKEEEFLRLFRDRCTTTIKPALERIASYIESKGTKARIDSTVEDCSSDGGRNREESITLHLLVGDARVGSNRYYGAEKYPRFSLMCEKREQRVMMYQSTIGPDRGGQAGAIGPAQLDQLTEEFLQEKVLELVQKVLE